MRAFPCKIHPPLIFYFSFFYILISPLTFFVLTNTFLHASEMWLWYCDGKKIHQEQLCLVFYFNDESGKLPRWNIYYTKCILLRRKMTREASGNYMYLQCVDLPSPHFCETSVSDLANIFGLWLVIWNQTFEFQICAFIFMWPMSHPHKTFGNKNVNCLVY